MLHPGLEEFLVGHHWSEWTAGESGIWAHRKAPRQEETANGTPPR